VSASVWQAIVGALATSLIGWGGFCAIATRNDVDALQGSREQCHISRAEVVDLYLSKFTLGVFGVDAIDCSLITLFPSDSEGGERVQWRLTGVVREAGVEAAVDILLLADGTVRESTTADRVRAIFSSDSSAPEPMGVAQGFETWSYEDGVLTLQGPFETWSGTLQSDGSWAAEARGYTRGRELNLSLARQ